MGRSEVLRGRIKKKSKHKFPMKLLMVLSFHHSHNKLFFCWVRLVDLKKYSITTLISYRLLAS